MQEEKHFTAAIISVTLFLFLFSFAIIASIASFTRRKRKLVFEKQILESRFQQELLQTGLEIQEHMFQTLSREIHDNVGQLLSLAKLNISLLSLEMGNNGKLSNIKELLLNAINELRSLGMGYQAEQLLDKGLISAIRYQVEQLEKTNLFTVSYEPLAGTIQVNKSKCIFLYRMVQEAFNNIITHSFATEISVKIWREQGKIHIWVEDDGIGFEPTEPGFTPGIGLGSIAHRAAIIDTEVMIESKINMGTIIHLICKEDEYD